MITMLGLDPGLASSGYAVAEVNLEDRTIARVVELGTLTTKRDNSLRVRRSSDDFRRVRSLVLQLRDLTKRHNIHIVAAEMATTAPAVRTSLNFGAMLGVIASLDVILIELLPKHIKRVVRSTSGVTKTEIISWALRVTEGQDITWPTSAQPNRMNLQHRGRNVTLGAEHQADALACIQAALSTEQMVDVIALQRALR